MGIARTTCAALTLASALVGFVPGAESASDCRPLADALPLANATTTQTTPTGTSWTSCFYTFNVPPGVNGVTFTLTSADFSSRTLYATPDVRYLNGQYYVSGSTCVRTTTTSNECTVGDPTPTTWYLRVDNGDMTGAAFEVQATLSRSTTCGRPVANALPMQNATPFAITFGTTAASSCFATISVPIGMGGLTFELASNGIAQRTLYATPDVRYVNGQYYVSGSTCVLTTAFKKACAVGDPASGVWYLRVDNDAQRLDGVTLTATYARAPTCANTAASALALKNGTLQVSQYAVPASASCYYTFTVPTAIDTLTFEVATTNGVQRTLYASSDVRYVNGQYYSTGATCVTTTLDRKACSVPAPTATTWYVRVDNDGLSAEPFSVRAIVAGPGAPAAKSAPAQASPATPSPSAAVATPSDPVPQPSFSLGALTIPSAAITGQPQTISVQIENHGTGSGTATVELIIDGQALAPKAVNIPAGGTAFPAFAYTPARTGDYDVTARVAGVGEVTAILRAASPLAPTPPRDVTSPTIASGVVATPPDTGTTMGAVADDPSRMVSTTTLGIVGVAIAGFAALVAVVVRLGRPHQVNSNNKHTNVTIDDHSSRTRSSDRSRHTNTTTIKDARGGTLTDNEGRGAVPEDRRER